MRMRKNPGLIHSQYKLAVFPLPSMRDLLVHLNPNRRPASFQYLGMNCTSLKTTHSQIQNISRELGESRIFMEVFAFRQKIQISCYWSNLPIERENFFK